ncbi:MAG: hypothetical protein FWD62_14945 [Betaproteobacteria bacterium]|nr:hypothetical protein [Betaproteobacteria bacterium]
MATFLFLQRFENGQPAGMPYRETLNCLMRYGEVGRGKADLELATATDRLAASCTIIGDEKRGVTCIGFERPRFDRELRRLVFELMAQTGCCLFDDALETVYASRKQATELPARFAELCRDGVRRISSAQQLWPDGLSLLAAESARPVLIYQNPNPKGSKYQFFDYGKQDARELYLEFRIHPQACNPGTLRVLKNLELRMDAVCAANPEFQIVYCFAHGGSALKLMEAPRLARITHGATILCPNAGEEMLKKEFSSEAQVFENARQQTADFAHYAKHKYALTLNGSAQSIRLLDALLTKIHLLYLQEKKAVRASGSAFSSAAAMRWAALGGSYLGEVMCHAIGGQWGRVEEGRFLRPAVRLHSGRICFPHLRVLDHVINGPRDSVADLFARLMQSDLSAAPRNLDFASNIHAFCQILIGQAHYAQGGLPFEAQIPRQYLDFSLPSLKYMDAYLAYVKRHPEALAGDIYPNLVIAAGCYLGEVLRRAGEPGVQWANYKDYARAHPNFEKIQESLGTAVFLVGKNKIVLPLAEIRNVLASKQADSLYDYAMEEARNHAPAVLAANKPAAPAIAAEAIDAWPAADAMAVVLRAVRQTLGDWRRLAQEADYAALKNDKPGWGQDQLGEVFFTQRVLLERGDVVWGALVQADNKLFKHGDEDLPGVLVFSRHPHFNSRPQALRRLGQELFANKGKTMGDSAMQEIGAVLANETLRPFNHPLPAILTAHAAWMSAFLVFRKHLPDGVLSGSWFPLLTSPETRAVMIVPSKFWPIYLVQQWQAGALNLEK